MSSVLAGVLPAGELTVGWGNLFRGPVGGSYAGTLGNERVPCRGLGGPVVNKLICDQHGVGQASALQGPVSDLQMSGHASGLPPSTGPAECWLSDSVVQARNRLFAYLNGQQVGIGDEESKEE